MSRLNKIPFNPPTTSVSGYKRMPPTRVPPHFMEAMKRLSQAPDSAAPATPGAQEAAAQSSAERWKASFKPLDEQNEESSAERTKLYDPSSPLSSDSEPEMSQAKDGKPFPASQVVDLLLSSARSRPDNIRWESSFSESGGQPQDGRESMVTSPLQPPPPRLKWDYQHQMGFMETAGPDQEPPPTKVTKSRDKTVIANRGPFTCDLCEVELTSEQELEDHLDSRTHWDTLEHIQQNNHYDDLVIAFLQEVLLCKSHHCSRAIEDNALKALQENDHMTKVEMFHCAACKVYIVTSADVVQNHITSPDHLLNTKEFKVQQRRTCLSKAESLLKEHKLQFERFLKSGSLLEGNY